MKSFLASLFLGIIILLPACSTTLAPDVVSVSNFDADRYLGKWYEIARIENRFEKGLSNVTAEYSLREDGNINVLNRGFDEDDQEWEDAKGKAFFVGDTDQGHLKVSFFGPFYGPYIVFELDQNYRYSFVTNNDKKYLWLLSRTPTISDELKSKFNNKINEMGFKTEKLIWVEQSKQ